MGIHNVKFHDSVHTTPFSCTQMKLFSIVYLHDNFLFVRLQNTLLNRRKRKLSEKSGPWDYRNRSIWEKYFPRGQMPSARQKRHHQTVSMKLADCQDSCRVFVLTCRSDHVIVYATAKLIVDGGLPNFRPTRLNDSGNFFRPLTKK